MSPVNDQFWRGYGWRDWNRDESGLSAMQPGASV